MLSSDLKTVVAPLTRTMTIIWGAFISATVIYHMAVGAARV